MAELRVLVQIRPNKSRLVQEIAWDMVLTLKHMAGDTEIKKE